jgi:hypothetical protein
MTYDFMTYDGFCAAADKADAETTARRQWGPWRLSTRHWELTFSRDGARYGVDLERISDAAAEALDWIAQLSGKSWITPSDLGHLVRALDDIFHLQGTLCGCGVNERIDPTAFLKRRYGKAQQASA